jgi:mRNA interferase RelE/StbE
MRGHQPFLGFNETARKQLKKLGRHAQLEILGYLDEWIASPESPRCFGKALKADLFGLWRYRVGDCRNLCQIQDYELIVLEVAVGHRRQVYR